MEDFDDLVRAPDEDGGMDLSHQAWATLDDAVWNWGGRLIALNVSFNAIRELPPQVGELICLRELNISNNLLETLPDAIAKCVRLRSLRVSSNRLVSVPEALSKCKMLEELYLSENRLLEVPSSFGEFPVLRVLHLQNNHLQVLCPEIGNLLALDEIDISHNEALTNMPPHLRDNCSFVQWMCRHNMSHQKIVEELEETNDDLEQAAVLNDEQVADLNKELEELKIVNRKLVQERPERYLKFMDAANKARESKTCAVQ